MAKKVYEEENIRAIADKIREKTGGDSTYKTSEIPEGINEVYNTGYEKGKAEGKDIQVELTTDEVEVGGLNGANGEDYNSSTNRARTGYIYCTTEYPVSIVCNSNVKWLVHFFNNGTWIGKTNFASINCENVANLFSTPNEVTHIRILLSYANDTTVANVDDLLSNFTITIWTVAKTYEDGIQEEYDRFWDSYQGTKTNYIYGFAGSGWNDETFKPKYPLSNMRYAEAMFCNAYITNLYVDIDTSNLVGVAADMFKDSKIETIKSFKFSSTIALPYAFRSADMLKNITIVGEIPFSTRFNDCPLTHESLMSIINALKDFCTTKIYPNVEWYVSSGPTLEFGAEYPCYSVYCDEALIEFVCENPICRIVVYDIDRITQEEANRTKSFKIEADGTLTLRLTNEGGTVKTLTLGETNLAKLTDKEKAMVTNKGWKLA